MKKILLSGALLFSQIALATADLVPTQNTEQSQAEFARVFSYTVGSDTTEAGSTDKVIVATAHAARRGDILRFMTAGANFLIEEHVVSVTTNTITLLRSLAVAPTIGDAFTIIRPLSPAVDSAGVVQTAGGGGGSVTQGTTPWIVAGQGTAGSAATGVVTVQGIASGTPVAVSGTTTQGTTATGSNQKKGKITCSALTGSYATLVATTFTTCIVHIFNSCNNTILISLDGGTTDFAELEAADSFSLDMCANGRHIASGVNIQAKHGGSAPTSGTVRASIAG